MFFAALFCVYSDYKTQNRKSNSKQKTSPQSYKTQNNILPFPGLTQAGTEQPGQKFLLNSQSILLLLIDSNLD